MRLLGCLLAVMVSVSGASAAPSVTVKVNTKGTLEFTPQNIRTLGVKQKRGDLVCVQFPLPPTKPIKLPRAHGPAQVGSPAIHEPRIYGGLRNDGGLTVARTRALTRTGPIPGKPGTAYKATVKKGMIILTPAG
jgi:hypothetical protein